MEEADIHKDANYSVSNVKGSIKIRLTHPRGLNLVDIPTGLVILRKNGYAQTFLGFSR